MFARRRIVGGVHHQLVQRARRVKGSTPSWAQSAPSSMRHIIATLLDQRWRPDDRQSRRSIKGASDDDAHDDVGIASVRRRGQTGQHIVFAGRARTVTPGLRRIRRSRRRSGLVVVRWRCLRSGGEAFRRWTMCQSSGLPAIGFSTLPGRRVEPMRAWMTATVGEVSGISGNSGPGGPGWRREPFYSPPCPRQGFRCQNV